MTVLAIHAHLGEDYQRVLLYVCGAFFILLGAYLLFRYLVATVVRRTASICKGSMWLLAGLGMYCWLRAAGLIATAVTAESTALYFVPPTIVYLAIMALLIYLWGSYSSNLASMYQQDRSGNKCYIALCSVVIVAVILILGFCVATLALGPPSSSAGDNKPVGGGDAFLSEVFTEIYVILDCCSCVVTGVALLIVGREIGGTIDTNEAISASASGASSPTVPDVVAHYGSSPTPKPQEAHAVAARGTHAPTQPNSFGSEEDPLIMTHCDVASRRGEGASVESGAINNDSYGSAPSEVVAAIGDEACGYSATNDLNASTDYKALYLTPKLSAISSDGTRRQRTSRAASHDNRRSNLSTSLASNKNPQTPEQHPTSGAAPANHSTSSMPLSTALHFRMVVAIDELRQLLSTEHAQRRILLSIKLFGVYSILRAPLSITLIVAGAYYGCQPQVSFGFYMLEWLSMVVCAAALIGPPSRVSGGRGQPAPARANGDPESIEEGHKPPENAVYRSSNNRTARQLYTSGPQRTSNRPNDVGRGRFAPIAKPT